MLKVAREQTKNPPSGIPGLLLFEWTFKPWKFDKNLFKNVWSQFNF